MENSLLNQSMIELFVYETAQNIAQLEEVILESEKVKCFSEETVNEIFRVMHTIKGAASMMMYDNVAAVSHSIEDLFYFIREEKSVITDFTLLSDLVLEGVDFIKLELEKIKNADKLDGDPSKLINNINSFLQTLKGNVATISEIVVKEINDSAVPNYRATIFFEEGCEMENIRAFSIVHSLQDIATNIIHYPEDIDSDASIDQIRKNGFIIEFTSVADFIVLDNFFKNTAFVMETNLQQLKAADEQETKQVQEKTEAQSDIKNHHQSIISVDVKKLDKLMDLMGEMVIAETMVTQNPEILGLQLDSFDKAVRQLKKITSEMQDIIMSIRMVPLALSFQKMNRIMRDMCKKLGKEAELVLIGEDTEVDKNIIEHISDPLMHLIRNSLDHGIESPEERVKAGKSPKGQIILEAKNEGSDVLIIVRDDGRGINKDKIIQKALRNNIIDRYDNLSDKEIFNLLFQPGFSTSDKVTEFSGRGVGLDVVVKNIEVIGGSVSMDSQEGMGSVTTLKIPLTLAIIDGMNIRVGEVLYTLPTTSIRETFQAKSKDLSCDPDGNEMIMVRVSIYRLARLSEIFGVEADISDLTQGIMLMIEQDDKCICLFADELIGQQQVVVKLMPAFFNNIKKVDGVAGCTLLGNGSISLILDVGGLMKL